jgi:signal transduction histidine kinase
MKRTAMPLLARSAQTMDANVGMHASVMWEHHRGLIVAVVAVLMLVKLALIVRLLVERRQRMRAQTAMEHQFSHLAHVSRVGTVGELAATLAHELRQPLAAIRYNAETAIRLIGQPAANQVEVKQVLHDIAADDARASDVIDRVVGLLRREERPPERVDLNDVCHGVRRLLHSAAAMRGATVELSLDAELPVIIGDPVQLQQVVLNLVLNALEALPAAEGNRSVVVSTAACGQGVELAVRDFGPGISDDVKDRLFEPFCSTKPQGLGMGLSIVRSIIERHGGTIQATNEPGGGALFRIVLPLEMVRPAPNWTSRARGEDVKM